MDTTSNGRQVFSDPEDRAQEADMQSQGCRHTPPCPPAESSDHDDARVVSRHPEQGWSLLCNSVVVFDDTGELLPDGRVVAPHRPAVRCAVGVG